MYTDHFTNWNNRDTKVLPGSENRLAVKKRAGDFIYDIERTYQSKKILVVSHGGTIAALFEAAQGLDVAQAKIVHDADNYFSNAQVESFAFTPLPHNDDYTLDYHRPYIDEIDLCDGETKLERIPDVFDCWFESGSMPYGQQHYPFENKEAFEATQFPAQFIAEGLDQTRGWFYSLIVLGTALFGKSPYENVIVNGLVLAEDGKKMSKSLKNYPDPMELADRVGADATRLYLMTSPVIRGEDLNFSEKEVLELQRKNLGRLHNVLAMYEMFCDGTKASSDSLNVLDLWIIARLNELISQSTEGYKNYELDKAGRPIVDFIDDLSVWYLRRSRDRFKGDDVEDKTAAIATLRYVLTELAKVIAPAMPFYAEYLWLAIRDEDEAESVHLTAWPEGGEISLDIIDDMKRVRELVTVALEARTKAGIKVRQPVASVSGPDIATSLQQVVLDEVNAKSYVVAETVTINTTITPELKAEGDAREFIRAIQEQRKANGFAAKDRITLTVEAGEAGKALIIQFIDDIQKVTGTEDIKFENNEGVEISAGSNLFIVSVVKN